MKKILYQYVNLLVDCVPQRRAHNHRTIGVYCGEVHLFSIPNREVKPTSADGTANAGEYDDATLGAPNRGPLFFVQLQRLMTKTNRATMTPESSQSAIGI